MYFYTSKVNQAFLTLFQKNNYKERSNIFFFMLLKIHESSNCIWIISYQNSVNTPGVIMITDTEYLYFHQTDCSLKILTDHGFKSFQV